MNEECKIPRKADYDSNVTVNSESVSTTYRLVLPYKDEQGQKIIQSVNNCVKRLLLHYHTAQHVYKSKKLGSSFEIKKMEHKHNLAIVKCPKNTCSETNTGKTAGRLNERIREHAGKDNKSYMLVHTHQSGHPSVSPNYIRILQKGYKSNKVKRQISETLLIRKHRTLSNIYESSFICRTF